MIIIVGVILTMVGVSFAAVPLYSIFCQVTGWGGTIQQAEFNRSKVYDREMTVKFNADINKNLPWEFKPDIHEVKVKIGQDALISYSAQNKSDKDIVGTAVYNVTPLKAGKYFNKTQCFCFTEQLLKAKENINMPVSFFIDPSIMDDRSMDDIKTITLSYTFYRHASSELEKAQENVYNIQNN